MMPLLLAGGLLQKTAGGVFAKKQLKALEAAGEVASHYIIFKTLNGLILIIIYYTNSYF